MNILIAGGGDVGVRIAQKLIYEGYNITLIEKNEKLIRMLKNKLDAMIIHGDATNVGTLVEADIQSAGLFIVVTNSDSDNLVACTLARNCGRRDLSIATKLDDYTQFFLKGKVAPGNFGLNTVVIPSELTIKKIVELIQNPDIFEIANYAGNIAQMVGVKVRKEFLYSSVPIFKMAQMDNIMNKIRLVAIQREGNIIIPRGNSEIYPNDKLYFVGRTEIVKEVVKKYFSINLKLNNVIIIGGSKRSVRLAKVLVKLKKNVVIIEQDRSICEEISSHLENVMVINGLATDRFLLDELKIESSCVVSMTSDDEYNILAAFMTKKYGASKTICMIKSTSIVNVINNLAPIDTVFSPHALTVGEILKRTRKDDLFSVSSFTEIDAETVGIDIKDKLPILNTPIKNISMPAKTIIGVIIRGKEVIIPTGEDEIKLGDRIIIFLLSDAIYEVEKIFSRRHGGGL
ncbi:Trk system potassium transporter TrkA [uncultured Ilyobacter sp.]|uniref:Trk system potassium transporter TrkA n=1 Tax=uncultured Ilyobacter sp. TaxID=544433 RepID=UPI0029C84746|nr:Trk system potassium transporter TrkA [uncultured Ilyobacter sp.]